MSKELLNNPIIAGIYGEMHGRPYEYISYYVRHRILTNSAQFMKNAFSELKLTNEQIARRMRHVKATLTLPVVENTLAAISLEAPWHMKGIIDFVYGEGVKEFTDDTVLTIACMEAILENHADPDFAKSFAKWVRKYPDAGYGASFKKWIDTGTPIESTSNVAVMRVAPIALAYRDSVQACMMARRQTFATHITSEAMRSAEAYTFVLSRLLSGENVEHVKDWIRSGYFEGAYGIICKENMTEVRRNYEFSSLATTTVAETFVAFIDSASTHNALLNVLYLPGDTDTLGMTTGVLAAAAYKDVTPQMVEYVTSRLAPEMVIVLAEFTKRYM